MQNWVRQCFIFEFADDVPHITLSVADELKTEYHMIHRIFFATTVIVTATVTASVAGQGPKLLSANEVGKGFVIIGELGVPVGKEITIKGFKRSIGPLQNQFHVEEVDGSPKARALSVNGIEDWPENTRATLRGYEVGTLRYLQSRDTNLGNGDKFKPYQTLFLTFDVLEVIEPKRLKLSQRHR